MTAEIVNLRRRRKRKAREDQARDAAERRTLFGESKSARQQRSALEGLESRKLDGKKRTLKPEKS